LNASKGITVKYKQVYTCAGVHNSLSALQCFPDHGSWHGMYWQMWASKVVKLLCLGTLTKEISHMYVM